MEGNFEIALNFTLKWEGGRTTNPKDPGKLTIFGIASKYHPTEVAEMDKLWQQGKIEEAKKIAERIYREKYWDIIGGDELADGIDIAIFDTAANLGPNKAVELWRKYKSIEAYLLARVGCYRQKVLENAYKKVFFFGWINRVIDLGIHLGKL